jgi:hypothetical protein
METSATQQVIEKTANPAGMTTTQPIPPGRQSGFSQSGALQVGEKKAVGYGMPCAHCYAYYPVDIPSCPICKSPERLSPTDTMVHSAAAVAPSETISPSAGTAVDAERERALQQLKAQASAPRTQINPAVAFQCVLKHQHSGAHEPAAVCHACYSDVRRQADLMEAALLIDTKDAAKIVYDAVWADTSDPEATYMNAAKALLAELRLRAGIGLVLGAHQTLAH